MTATEIADSIYAVERRPMKTAVPQPYVDIDLSKKRQHDGRFSKIVRQVDDVFGGTIISRLGATASTGSGAAAAANGAAAAANGASAASHAPSPASPPLLHGGRR
jgi:hypothetical protein